MDVLTCYVRHLQYRAGTFVPVTSIQRQSAVVENEGVCEVVATLLCDGPNDICLELKEVLPSECVRRAIERGFA